MRPVLRAWDRFWFTPAPTSTLAVLRIGVGILALVTAVTLWPDLGPFYGATWIGTPAARALDATLLFSAVLLVVGFRTRLASVAVLLCLAELAAVNPFVFNSGDNLLRYLALFVALAPAGAALSVDCLRREGTVWRFPLRPVWPLRLVQIQVTVMYAAAVWHKFRGASWPDGTAASYPLRIPDMVRFTTPSWVSDSVSAAHLLTWGTLAIEAAIPVLVWNRRTRSWVLGLGVALHLGIDATLRAGLFSWVVLVAYLAFVPPETMEGLLERLRARLERRGASASRDPQLPDCRWGTAAATADEARAEGPAG